MQTTFHSILLDLAPGDGSGVPARIQLLPPSGFTGRDGRGPYTYDADSVLAAFSSYGMPLPMDYEHQSLTAIDKTDPTPASGWINSLSADETGVYGDVEWTERASGFIAAREYRFISPVFTADKKTGEVQQLVGAGVTNNPNLKLASFNSIDFDFAAAASHYTREHNSRAASSALTKHMKDQLLALYGLPADASDEAIVAAATAAKTDAAHAKAAAEAVGAATTDGIVTAAQSKFSTDLSVFVPKADFEAMSTRATKAETELAAHKTESHKAEVAAVVEAAKVAGKITPAQVAHAQELGEKDIDLLRAFVGSATPVVNKGAAVDAHAKGTGTALTAEQLELCRVSNMTPEAFSQSLKDMQKA
jgi:phage I-like protein